MSNKVINLFGNEFVQNTGVKYSELLEQFITPFAKEFTDVEYYEDVFEFAINAWNMANIQAVMPEDELDKAMKTVEQEGTDLSLLKKMVAHKIKKYKAYTNFIVDYEFVDDKTGKNPVLRVVTQEKDTYLASMFNQMEDDDLDIQEEFEENYINRSAIIIKPKQPFLDWFSDLNPEDDFEDELKQTNIYLIDEDTEDVEKFLRKKFDKFFKMELEEWHDNKKEWPQKRNYKMFNLWFQVDVSEMIYDIEKRPVKKSEY
ncbi:hypothetical protein [Tamlana sp. I1]|uniref:hypothetical protein n=1 Tax=Tamlana sp. I1 TaxID=2762061 RepID=UPI00188E9448|nr:hypothetical protein [Tamlana sp. I1]